MIGTGTRVCKDGTGWWRQEGSAPDHHLKNWKVMLWVVASLVTLVEGVSPEEDNKDMLSRPLPPGQNKSSQPPAVHAEGRRLSSQPPAVHAEGRRLSSQPPAVHAEGRRLSSQPPAVHTEGRRLQRRTSSIMNSHPAIYEEAEDERRGRWGRSAVDGAPYRPDRKKRRRTKQQQSSRDCRVERKEMRVRDLGLGYDSDEIVLFKYCVGNCHSARKNYDLALRALMENGSVVLAADPRAVSTHPCCRPTRYETVSFMDAQTVWQTIKWLSAANCSCVG